MINKITIKEIKGIEFKEFSFNIVSNKPNLFVAPNGFGKSSLATAFSSMKRTGIELDEGNLFKHKKDTSPEVIIQMNTGETFTANKDTNEIYREFSIEVINSQLYPRAATRNFGSFSSTSADICVRPITIYKTIPKKKFIVYSYTEMKESFGSIGKLLTNIGSLFKNPIFVYRLSLLNEDLKKLVQVRNKTIIDKFLLGLGTCLGTKKQLIEGSYDFSKLNAISEFSALLNLISNFKQVKTLTIADYLDAIQLIRTFENNKADMDKIYKYHNYLLIRAELDELLSNMNTTWRTIKTKKTGNSLVLELPPATEISNGERDILCFIAKLYEVKSKLIKPKSILIIDEIFDYLDDGNLITAQYYINQIIDESIRKDKKVYPIILTHLDPQYFKTYAFNLKNVNYLDSSIDIINKYNFNNALKNRNEISVLSTHFLHYHPEEVTEPLMRRYQVGEKIINSRDFYLVVEDELKRYLSDKRYDVAMVCSGLRLYIEKKVYYMLQEEKRAAFIKEHGTSNKLDYASTMGIVIPETYYMLGIIYNEAVHLDPQGKKLIPVGQKLKNRVIKKMIKDVLSDQVIPVTCNV